MSTARSVRRAKSDTFSCRTYLLYTNVQNARTTVATYQVQNLWITTKFYVTRTALTLQEDEVKKRPTYNNLLFSSGKLKLAGRGNAERRSTRVEQGQVSACFLTLDFSEKYQFQTNRPLEHLELESLNAADKCFCALRHVPSTGEYHMP